MENNSQFGVVAATGFILGVTVGTVAALMLAPQTGRTTRRMLRERAGTLRDRIRGNGRLYDYEPEAALTNVAQADYLH